MNTIGKVGGAIGAGASKGNQRGAKATKGNHTGNNVGMPKMAARAGASNIKSPTGKGGVVGK